MPCFRQELRLESVTLSMATSNWSKLLLMNMTSPLNVASSSAKEMSNLMRSSISVMVDHLISIVWSTFPLFR